MTDQHQKRVSILLEALPYIKQFSGKTVVIKYGGSAMKSDDLKEGFATDIALLKYVGMNPVIVHGGGPDINTYMKKLSMEVRFVQGLRVTDEATMELAKMVLVGKVNKEVVALINQHGVPAVGLGGDDGRLIVAEKRVVTDASGREQDIGQVGRILNINTAVLENLGADFIPVVASVGADEAGTSYNINADEVAADLAVALGAEKAIFLTDVEGLYADIEQPDSLISQCSAAEVEQMMASGVASKGMIPKLRAVSRTLAGGVRSAHIIDGRVPHAVLLEIFTREGIGTKITGTLLS
ncbi:MAG: acetylglutamate kinase [Thermoleophilia bacterium]|jgi:acetylglutamate kinase|nr:acetylglutamate kinase [Actinomycetota bacterium]MCL6093774.1 acetylglutamate kinase [Actinomycetota bacterium]MDA8166610.1 acetylglutamate kinase [Actinomycetota bacterium]